MPKVWLRKRYRLCLRLSTICLFVLFASSLASSCSTPLENEPQVTVRSTKQLESRAIEESKKWRADAYLTGIDISAPTFDSPSPPALSPFVGFSFHSWSDSSHSYSIDFHTDGTIKLREWRVFLSSSDYVPIEPIDWIIDSTDAWSIAWVNGGRDFALKYPTAIQTALIKLARWDPPRSGPVWWYVAFLDAQQQRSLYIFIDAKTGEVVRKKTQ